MSETTDNGVARWFAVQEKASELRMNNPGWRQGQAMFNALYEMDPALANTIRGTMADPFFRDAHIPAFAARVIEGATS